MNSNITFMNKKSRGGACVVGSTGPFRKTRSTTTLFTGKAGPSEKHRIKTTSQEVSQASTIIIVIVDMNANRISVSIFNTNLSLLQISPVEQQHKPVQQKRQLSFLADEKLQHQEKMNEPVSTDVI